MAASAGAQYRCFVGGLAWATDERDLEAAFRPFGEILDAKIINDRETGRPRGFGFVTLSSEQSMRDAIQGMNGKKLGGRSITVNEARPRQSEARGGSGRCAHCGNSSGNSDSRRVPTSASGMNHPTTEHIFAPFFAGGNLDRRGPGPGMNHRTTDEIFAQFFEECPGQHRNGGDNSDRRGPGSGMNPDDIFAQFFERPSFQAPGEASVNASQRPRKAAPIEHQLACNLADLYKGTTKKMKISRELSDSSGRRTVVQEILTVGVKPGWKKGTKITFAEKGNEAPNVIPADIVFIIDEKPHDQFTREGNDLVMTQKISLAEDWARYNVHVTTLDGRNLTVPIKSVVKPGYEEVVPGEGMPIPKDPCKKGNLRIKFNISILSGAEKGN
ncbi:unnamed protein product [Alopecurus aequalis]